jgi:hypothetical protein
MLVEPLSSPSIAELFCDPLTLLGQPQSIMAAADLSLRQGVSDRRLNINSAGDEKLSNEMRQLFASAQLGYLPRLRVDSMSWQSAVLHAERLPLEAGIAFALKKSKPNQDATAHVTSEILATTLRDLMHKRQSRLIDFDRPNGAPQLYETEEVTITWTGTPDLINLWNSITRLGNIIPAALADPNLIRSGELLRATHFCAAASRILTEPTKPMTPEEKDESRQGN